MRTTIYVDGLNLYHGSVQGTNYKRGCSTSPRWRWTTRRDEMPVGASPPGAASLAVMEPEAFNHHWNPIPQARFSIGWGEMRAMAVPALRRASSMS